MKRYVAAYGAWLAAVLVAAGVAYYYYRRVLAIGEAELAKMNGHTPAEKVPARRRAPKPEPELVEPGQPASPSSDAGAPSSGEGSPEAA